MRKAAPAAVDVLIPAYNSERTIESAVASIQAQTVRDIRIIVVNDGSTDATREILERMALADARLDLIHQENRGIVDALNVGLARCTAPFIARLDADDIASPDRFARQLAFLGDHLDCIAVSGAVTHIDVNGRTDGGPQHLRSPDLSDPAAYPQCEPYLVHPFLMLRRTAIEAVGGYRHVFLAEDTDLYWRLQERGQLANMPDLLGFYRIHDRSLTSSSILNGRIVAVNSQLSGLSALRRRAGRPDIPFPKSALSEFYEARSLEAILAVASRRLDAEEADRLAVASCAKMLEMAAYRPYELDAEDCGLIRAKLLPALPRMTATDRAVCRRMLSGSAARIVARRKLGAAFRLAPLRLYPMVAARLAFRTALSPTSRRMIRRLAGRVEYSK